MGVNERYSRRRLPAYRYVPGRTPHPVRDPLGHAHGAAEPPAEIDPERWAECEPHLWAVDLFNAGYYWEAHEAWEGLWRAAGRRTETGRFLQGLIQLCAALVKHAMDAPRPALRLARRGSETLRSAAGPRLGIDGVALAAAVRDRVAGHGSRPLVRLARVGRGDARGPS